MHSRGLGDETTREISDEMEMYGCDISGPWAEVAHGHTARAWARVLGDSGSLDVPEGRDHEVPLVLTRASPPQTSAVL